ncbi:MAG: queuosine precursor transporter [Saprospiraceae bacterium]|nr:queuosine precursor transporter [Saprospiraceae bacterium]
MQNIIKNKQTLLFILLAGVFITNALLAEFIGVKIFSLERTIGLEPFNIKLFGIEHLSFNLTAGVLLWPIVFIMTDIINEYYGPKGVKFLSYLTCGLIIYSFIVVYGAIQLVPADFWPKSHFEKNPSSTVGSLSEAYQLIYGQGLWIIMGSVVAFLVGQIVDVFIFHKIKLRTGTKNVWMRATGSTLVSQLIDSFVVLFIAFRIGQGWSMNLVLAICTVNYIYKFSIAILLTPVIYLVHNIIDRFLGDELAEKMKKESSI